LDIEELRQDRAVKDWFTLVKPKPITGINYLRALKIYCDFIGKSPAGLIQEADKEAEEGMLIKRRSIRRYLLDYIDFLNNSRASQNTVKLRLAVVKSFYNKLDVQLPNLPRNENSITNIEENTKIPTKEDLQTALHVCDILERAVLLAGVSSALSSDDLRNLKVKQFLEGYDPETEVTTLSMRRGKTSIDHITFFSAEASRAIWDYLNWRNERESKDRDTNRERQLEKQRVFSDDGYLFVLQRIPDSWLINKNEEERKFKRNTFMEIYRSISEKAGMSSPKGQPNLIRSHNMRRYCFSALINANFNSTTAEFIMGHKLPGSQAAYYRSNVEDLKREYIKLMPFITVQKELDISESPEYQQIKKENIILQAETARHVVERSELQEMRTELKKLKELEQNIPELLQVFMRSPEAMEAMKKLKDQGQLPATEVTSILPDLSVKK
jgi:hypothetical protein